MEGISNLLLTFMGEETQGLPESNNDIFVKLPEIFRQLFYLSCFCRLPYSTRALPSFFVIITIHTYTNTYIFAIVSCFLLNLSPEQLITSKKS